MVLDIFVIIWELKVLLYLAWKCLWLNLRKEFVQLINTRLLVLKFSRLFVRRVNKIQIRLATIINKQWRIFSRSILYRQLNNIQRFWLIHIFYIINIQSLIIFIWFFLLYFFKGLCLANYTLNLIDLYLYLRGLLFLYLRGLLFLRFFTTKLVAIYLLDLFEVEIITFILLCSTWVAWIKTWSTLSAIGLTLLFFLDDFWSCIWGKIFLLNEVNVDFIMCGIRNLHKIGSGNWNWIHRRTIIFVWTLFIGCTSLLSLLVI